MQSNQTTGRVRALSTLTALAFSVTGICAAAAVPPSIDLPGDQVYPENITSARDGTIYVGSFAAGGVLRIKPHSTKAEMWIKPGDFGTRSILGVLADDKSHMLWVCSDDISAIGVAGPTQEPGAWLKGFDLSTGKGKVSAKLPGEKALCNDIAVGPDGAAYVSNTLAPQILRLAKGAKALDVWSEDPMLAPAEGGSGLDGLAFGADGNLYIDKYSSADLFRVDVKGGKAGKVTKLTPSRQLVLADAIRPLSGNSFLLIEGGGRLDKITVNGDDVAVETLKDGYALPTGVTIVGKTAWVSEGQLNVMLDPAKKGTSPTLPFHIYSVALSSSK